MQEPRPYAQYQSVQWEQVVQLFVPTQQSVQVVAPTGTNQSPGGVNTNLGLPVGQTYPQVRVETYVGPALVQFRKPSRKPQAYEAVLVHISVYPSDLYSPKLFDLL